MREGEPTNPASAAIERRLHRWRHCQRSRETEVRKRSGAVRRIRAPFPEYMLVLRELNSALKSALVVSEFTYGFTKGRGVIQNARRHCGKAVVVNLDGH